MKNLNWKPSYNHAHVVPPPETSLTGETAAEVYEKLKNFWAIKIRSQVPAGGWSETPHRHLFTPNGFHHPVRWMPKLQKGWRRMKYYEFLSWYGIKEIEA